MKINYDPKKAKKVILYYFIAFFIFIGGPVVYLKFIISDIPTIDDSDMKIVEKNIPENENAYPRIIQLVGTTPNNIKDPFSAELSEAEKNIVNGIPKNKKQFDKDIIKFKKQLEVIDLISKMKYSKGPQKKELAAPMPNYLDILYLSKFGLALARRDFSTGSEDEAFAESLNMAHLGLLVEQLDGGTSIMSLMVGNTIKQAGLLTTNEFLDTGYLPDNPQNIIFELSGLYESDDAWIAAWKSEYFIYLDLFASYKPGSSLFKLMIKPERIKRALHDMFNGRIKDSSKKTVSEIKPFEATFSPTKDFSPEYFRQLSQGELATNILMTTFSGSNFTRAQEKKYYIDCFTDLTRLRLAILQYQRDNGDLPESLIELTPKYIEVIPIDRFDGKSLRYDKERKIIYSAGMNLKDDRGSFKNTITEKPHWNEIRKEKDIALRIAK
ncbi:MAG: hypothetical protein WCX65_15775 [bacterium]